MTKLNRFRTSIKQMSLNDKRDFFEMIRYEVETTLHTLLDGGKISISCYGSDGRLDRWSEEKGSMDLIVCIDDEEIESDEIKKMISTFVDQVVGIIIDNSYWEGDEKDGHMVKDEILIGKELSVLSQNEQLIDIMRFSDEKHKYKDKYFPDRIIDAQHVLGNSKVLDLFKKEMMKGIFMNPKIIKKFKDDVRQFFKENNIRGENTKKDKNNHYDLESGIIRLDYDDFYGFKYGPMRALQYKIIEGFLKYSNEIKDENLIIEFPSHLTGRLSFFEKKGVIKGFSKSDYQKLNELYIFFKDINEVLEKMYFGGLKNNKKGNIKQNTKGEFEFEKDYLTIVTNNLDEFIQLFNRIKF